MSELGHLLYLLYDAHNRIGTVYGCYQAWEETNLAHQAFCRDFPKDAEEEEFEQRRPSFPPSESTAELWLEWPERVRVDTRYSREGEDRILLTKKGELWEYFPESGVNHRVGGHARHVLQLDVFDPAFLLSDLQLEPAGPARSAGREAIAVRLRPRPSLWEHGFTHLDLLEEIVVDCERGTLLAGLWRFEGQEMRRFEFTEISFDDPIAAEIFTPDVPTEPREWGEQFPKPVRVTIEEGAARTSFSVWALPALPPEWSVEAWYVEHHPERPESFRIAYARRDATAQIGIELQAAAKAQRHPERVSETIEREGRTIHVIDRHRGGGLELELELELENTLIEIHSELPMELLVDIATKLTRID